MKLKANVAVFFKLKFTLVTVLNIYGYSIFLTLDENINTKKNENILEK